MLLYSVIVRVLNTFQNSSNIGCSSSYAEVSVVAEAVKEVVMAIEFEDQILWCVIFSQHCPYF